MPTSDEDLQQKQERVQQLREQLAAEESKRVQVERETSNDVTAAQLDAEAARLEASIEASRTTNETVVNSDGGGVTGPLQAVQAEVALAEQQRDAEVQLREARSSTDDNKEN